MTEWQSPKLKDLLIDSNPGFACGEDDPVGVFQFRMNNLNIDGSLDFSKIRRVPQNKKNLKKFYLQKGDVLFNATNSPELVGKSAFFPGHSEIAVYSNHFVRLRPRDDVLEGRYLARWLQAQFRHRVFRDMCRQWVNQATVSREALLGLSIPLPPIATQKHIAAILDQAEELRSKRRSAIALLDELGRSVFLEMFGDPDSILQKWNTTTLGNTLDFLTSGSRGWASYYSDSGDLFLRIQNVKSDQLVLNDVAYVKAPDTAEAKRTLVQPGDVLLSITADLGRTAVIPEGLGKAYINQHLCILRTKQFSPRFLSAYFASPAGQRQVFGRNRQAVKAGLNFDDVRSFNVPLPPLELQQQFAERMEAIESLKATHRQSLAKLDTLFASLQHRAFRGELESNS